MTENWDINIESNRKGTNQYSCKTGECKKKRIRKHKRNRDARNVTKDGNTTSNGSGKARIKKREKREEGKRD